MSGNIIHTIPGKQLCYVGVEADLRTVLHDREIGYCTDRSQCLMKSGNALVPVSAPEMPESEVAAILGNLESN